MEAEPTMTAPRMLAARPKDVVALTEDLIRIQSHDLAPGREAEVGRFLVSWFQQQGVDARYQEVVDGRSNVIATVPGGDGPSLMLCGHLDTMPAGAMDEAFTPVTDAGQLRGRGACDMKGAVAAMALTVTAAHRSSGRLAGDLVFAGTVGEETGSIGVKHLMEDSPRIRYAVVGEPTCLRVGTAHKGACFIRISLRGRGAHGSTPELGVNAVSCAARIVHELESSFRTRLNQRTHPLLGPSTVNVGRVCGGTHPNVVAESCQIDVDRRTIPGEDDPLGEVRSVVADVCDSVDGLAYNIQEMEETATVPHRPLGTTTDAKLVTACRQACRQMHLDDSPVGLTYWTDGGHLSACGVETVILGPGDIALAHGPDESVPTKDLIQAVSIYSRLTETLLNPQESR